MTLSAIPLYCCVGLVFCGGLVYIGAAVYMAYSAWYQLAGYRWLRKTRKERRIRAAGYALCTVMYTLAGVALAATAIHMFSLVPWIVSR